MTFASHIQMNARLLARFGGPVTLSRTIPGIPDPSTPWIPVVPTTITEDVQFIATEAGAEWVAAGLILMGDLVGILDVPQTVALNPPKPGDTINAGARAYAVLRAEPVHSDPNAVIHFRLQARA